MKETQAAMRKTQEDRPDKHNKTYRTDKNYTEVKND